MGGYQRRHGGSFAGFCFCFGYHILAMLSSSVCQFVYLHAT